MNFREYINQINEKANLPIINIPATQKDLETLFDEINKNFFNNELVVPKIKFAPLAKNYFGKAHVDYTPEGKIKKLLITISSKIINDQTQLVNTMAHEMIHIWQFLMNEKEKTRKFTDATFAEIMASNDKHTWGHNSYFLEKMKKLNKLGFNIDIVSDAPNGIELTEEVYGILINQNIVLWNPKDPSNFMDSIIESVEDRIGVDVLDYTIFKTKESNITLTTRITKDWKLPLNVLNVKFSKKWIDDLINSSNVDIIKSEENLKLSSNSDILPEIKEMLPKISKWKSSGFNEFFKTCWLNAYPELGKIVGRELYSENKEFKGAKVPNKLSLNDAKYIYDYWSNITDSEIKKLKAFVYFLTDLKFMVLKKKQNINSINNILFTYDSDFKDRVQFPKFKSLLADFIINEFKKEFKKSGKEFDLNYVKSLNIFLENTRLENLF